jgi:hypothetical protein
LSTHLVIRHLLFSTLAEQYLRGSINVARATFSQIGVVILDLKGSHTQTRELLLRRVTKSIPTRRSLRARIYVSSESKVILAHSSSSCIPYQNLILQALIYSEVIEVFEELSEEIVFGNFIVSDTTSIGGTARLWRDRLGDIIFIKNCYTPFLINLVLIRAHRRLVSP